MRFGVTPSSTSEGNYTLKESKIVKIEFEKNHKFLNKKIRIKMRSRNKKTIDIFIPIVYNKGEEAD